MAPPSADQRAIDFVRAGPLQSAAMRARWWDSPCRRTTRRRSARQPGPRQTVRRRPSGTPGSTGRRPGSTSFCGRTGHPERRATTQMPRARASSRPPPGRAREASNAMPISGSATLPTERFKFATAATRISDSRTIDARSGRVSACGVGAGDAVEALCVIRPDPPFPWFPGLFGLAGLWPARRASWECRPAERCAKRGA